MRVNVAMPLALALFTAARSLPAVPPRYLTCHEEIAPLAMTPPRAKPPEEPDWIPLPRRHPPALARAKLEVFDVAESDPMPSRRVASVTPQAPPAPEPPPVPIESKNTFYCIGIPRGTAGILRVIAAPRGARFYGRPYLESWRQENIEAAGELDISSARPLLRRVLARPAPPGIEAWEADEISRSKAAAARALADLGDTASAPGVLSLLRSLERDGFNLWREVLPGLGRLDPALAQKYALELIDRAVSDPKWLQQDPQLYDDLLPLVITPGADALAVLRRASSMLTKDDVALPHGGGGCKFLAARVRLGDAELTRELRAEINTASLATERGVECYSTLMPVLYPGRDASELDVLMYRHRYAEILAWLDATRGSGADPAIARAKAKLAAWLHQRSSAPDVAGDRTRSDFIPEKRALHLVALSALGDKRAEKDLATLITDPKDDGTAPWVAAHWALRLELPKAADLTVVRLRLAFQHLTQRYSTESWPERGALVITEHGQVIDDLAQRGDDRFVLGLLDRDGFTRALTTSWLARKRPASACELVGAAARGAMSELVDDAFWALSLLGDRCRSTMRRLARDASQPDAVRGMANEHLAMLRDATVPANDAALERLGRFGPTLWRAHIIYTAPE